MQPGPTLVIVGAPKSGSTALFHYLADHPDLAGHVHREMPFFGRDDEFTHGWPAAVEKYYPRSARSIRLVAKHTMAMYDITSLRRIAESTTAIIAGVLRDPVPRAYSHYHYARLRGWEDAATFEEGLEREERRTVSSPRRARDLQYVGDGIYAPHVRDMLELFPPERRRVYLSDDLRREPLRLCAELFDLAGLPPHEPDVTRHHNEARTPRSPTFARVFLAAQQPGSPLRAIVSRVAPSRMSYRARYLVNRLNERRDALPALSEETAARLRRRFAEPNAALSDMLGRPLTEWNR